MDMELVLPMYNAHPHFSFKNLGKNCTLYMAKYGIPFQKSRQVKEKLCRASSAIKVD